MITGQSKLEVIENVDRSEEGHCPHCALLGAPQQQSRAVGTYGDVGEWSPPFIGRFVNSFLVRGWGSKLYPPHTLDPTNMFDIPASLQSIPWFGGGLLFYGAKANNGSIISCFEEEKKTLLLFFEATQNSIVKSRSPANTLKSIYCPCHSFGSHLETIY